MRVFAALALPAAVAAGIASAFSRARAAAPRVKWVAIEGLHLTLHFFGEVPDAEVAAFGSVFADPGLRRDPVVAQLGSPDFFPPSGMPRVLWVGLRKGAEELREYWARLTERLQVLRRDGGPLRNWSPDPRGFSPHITVARSGAVPLDRRLAADTQLPQEEFRISECVLYQSILGPAGARYLPLMTIGFQAGAS